MKMAMGAGPASVGSRLISFYEKLLLTQNIRVDRLFSLGKFQILSFIFAYLSMISARIIVSAGKRQEFRELARAIIRSLAVVGLALALDGAVHDDDATITRIPAH
ncbi:hypothetical protein HL658_19865 [Azospirillum sp. RWY-5-1]|uniref:Uncharacterized protein n=1 Tax=Azospirillum oleiclasticum TaxID=2735135 RepID=A0ABX2TGQ3_9PROT|nr:hypothetical protein [Azospirillum oleiclasticum]NYZ14810.1 hypothetical protein [Azospirillum oleiclasticum]NYZ22204.1 hypothetical protein [Azospirillum oleiclasticum]